MTVSILLHSQTIGIKVISETSNIQIEVNNILKDDLKI